MTRRVAPALAALVLACGGGGGLKPGDPAQLLTQAGSAILSVHTLAADLKFSQGAVMFQGFALSSAEARVSLPSDSDATYKVRQGDLLVAIGVILVGGRTFLRPPFGVYGELTPAQAKDIPDLARLFDPQRALPAVVPAGRDPRYLGADRIDGVRHAALVSQELLGPQRDPNGLLRRKGEGLVHAVRVERLSASQDRGKRLNRDPDGVVLRLLRGERDPRGLGMEP